MERDRTRPGGGRDTPDRPRTGRPAGRSRHLHAVPVHVAASEEAESAARELISSAREEAGEQARLAMEYARMALAGSERVVELLRLADQTQAVIDA
jgi:hypothetical protein